MAYKQKQGRSEFSKTGRGITSKLAGPGDPPHGDISMPSTRKINYTGGKSAKKYNTSLKDSLVSQNMPTGNYAARFHSARSAVKGAAALNNISQKKASSTLFELGNYEANTSPVTQHQDFRGHGRGYDTITRYKGNDNLNKNENQAERVLMNIEKQNKTNWKNRSQQKITGAFGSDLRKMQYNKKGYAQDATTYPNRFSDSKKQKKKK